MSMNDTSRTVVSAPRPPATSQRCPALRKQRSEQVSISAIIISYRSIKSEVDREEKYDFCIVIWKQYIIFVP